MEMKIFPAPILLYKPALFVVGLPLFMVQYPWGCSSLPRVTPPLQRELLRLILSSCRSPREPTSASLQEVSRDGTVQGAKPQIRAGSKSLLFSYSKVVDLEPFRPPASPGPIRAVFGPPRKRTPRQPERRTGTRVQRDDPSSKVHEDEHDDELDDDDDDDAANDFKISSKDPRCPQIEVPRRSRRHVKKPTSCEEGQGASHEGRSGTEPFM